MRIGGRTGFIVITVIAASACATTPDLTVQFLAVDPAQAAPGAEIVIESTVRNAGAAPAPLPVQAAVSLTGDQEGAAIADLTSWERAEGAPLQPNEAFTDTAPAATPMNLAPGAYYVCADADPDDILPESDELNNRLCAPFSILAGPAAAADLVIEKVTAHGESDASLRVRIKIRNAGVAEAKTPFRIMAFRRSPRAPLHLKECPLTEGQLAAGSPSSCADVVYAKPLAAGAADEIEGYFNYVVAGAEPVRQPLRPGAKKPRVTRTVDFMVDGCFKPVPPDRPWCAINEIDEINNFKAATLKAR